MGRNDIRIPGRDSYISKAIIGQRIKEIRIARGLKRSALSNWKGYISAVENNRKNPQLAKLERIAEKLGIGVWRLFIQKEQWDAMLSLEDRFCFSIMCYLRKLNQSQREYILKVLEAAPKNDTH